MRRAVTDVPQAAAVLYGLAISLDLAADDPIARDPQPVIDLGRRVVDSTTQLASDRDRVFYLDAAASFLRAWSRHAGADKARDLIAAAEDLEAARDMALATMPGDDA
jgi:hypothetical protein